MGDAWTTPATADAFAWSVRDFLAAFNPPYSARKFGGTSGSVFWVVGVVFGAALAGLVQGWEETRHWKPATCSNCGAKAEPPKPTRPVISMKPRQPCSRCGAPAQDIPYCCGR